MGKRNKLKNMSKKKASKVWFYREGFLYTHRFKKPLKALKDSHGRKYVVAASSRTGKKLLYLAHNVIWNLHYGKIPKGLFVDHKDTDSLNNNISNLRLVTHRENIKNQDWDSRISGQHFLGKGASGAAGVHKSGSKTSTKSWVSKNPLGKKKLFHTVEEASKWYQGI